MGAARGPEIIGWVESSGGPEMQQRCTQWSTEAGFIHRAPPASTGEGAPQQRAGGSHPLEEKARAPGVELMFGCGARIIPQRLRRWERSTAAGGVLSLRRSQAEAKVRPPWQRQRAVSGRQVPCERIDGNRRAGVDAGPMGGRHERPKCWAGQACLGRTSNAAAACVSQGAPPAGCRQGLEPCQAAADLMAGAGGAVGAAGHVLLSALAGANSARGRARLRLLGCGG